MPLDLSQAARALSRADRSLAPLIERVGPCTLARPRRATPFQMLLKSIVYQQLSGKAAATIHARVLAQLPRVPAEQPAALAALPAEALRACGMSRAKVAAAHDLAAKTLDGTTPTARELSRLDDAQIVERLTRIRGVGVWTVEMLLIFHLLRPDVLPVGDLGVRKGFMLLRGETALPTPAALAEHGERWRPYRSVASWYLWRAVDLTREAGSEKAAW